MFFLISKLLWLITAPATLLLGLAAAGVLAAATRWARLGRGLVVVGIGGLVAAGILPLGAALLRPLEDRFPQPPATLMAPDGIIVLGGSTDQALEEGRHRVTIADAADRLTEAVILARRYPEARLVFSGGSAAITGSRDTEAADARRLWVAMGVPDARITTEDRSRNTDENVRFSRRIVEPRPGQRWLLVTSAFHMPRAVGLFRANDWAVIPYPVDYRTRGTPADFRPGLDVAGNLARLNLAAREWIGLVAYALSGRTAQVLPDRQAFD